MPVKGDPKVILTLSISTIQHHCVDWVGLRTGDKCLIICIVYMDGEVGSGEVPLAVILLFCK